MERAWDDAKYGRPSERPMIELTIPTTYDPSLAPTAGTSWASSCNTRPTPCSEANWDELRDPFADRVVSLIEEYVPNIRVHHHATARC